MALVTNVTPASIATALGMETPGSSTVEYKQFNQWIDDALMLIQARVDTIDPEPTVGQARLDYVIREAVVAHANHPDDSTNVTVSVDDASTSRTYRSGKGRVSILDEWWELLGLAAAGGGAFDMDTVSTATVHLAWCSLSMGAAYCSCGADIAGFPLFEGGQYA